ncbi:hypothetical protein LguiA_015823 [Lonicera macranthoides]
MGRAPCCSKVGLHRGAWSLKEDKLLTQYIQSHGEGHWKSLPSNAGLLRCGKSCRLRWKNYLQPGIKRGNITTDEEDLIIRLHSLLGNRWSIIARKLAGRTDNDVKNHWNTHLRKRVLKDTPIDQPDTSENPEGKNKNKKKGTVIISNEDVTESNKTSESNSSHGSSSTNGGVELQSITTKASNHPWPFFEDYDEEDVLQDVLMSGSGCDLSVKYWSVFTDDNKLEKLYDECLQLLNWEEHVNPPIRSHFPNI